MFPSTHKFHLPLPFPVNGVFDPSVAGIGMHTISFTFHNTVEGCSFFSSIIINIIGDLQPPVISCTATMTEIVFIIEDTNPPGDAADYNYSHTPLIGTISIVDNMYTVSDLNQGDAITLTAEYADSTGVCPVETVMAVCNVINCTDPQLFFEEVPDICFGDSLLQIILNAGSTIDLEGTSSFEGPGIIDSAIGIFDPLQAGVGSHTVSLTYITESEDCVFISSIMINVVEPPSANFMVNSPICVTAESIIVFENTGGTLPSIYMWDIGSATGPLSGLDGGGPYIISFTEAGVYDISLTTGVELNGGSDVCISAIEMLEIIVEDTVQVPVIICFSSADSIVFTWEEDPNAMGYLTDISAPDYAVVEEASGRVSISNLEELDIVALSITALSDNNCEDAMSILECIALGCPNVELILDNLVFCAGEDGQDINFEIVNSSALSGNEIYTWSIDTPFGDEIDRITGTLFSDQLAKGEWTVSLTINDGDCTYIGNSRVEVQDALCGQVVLTDLITPDGDGINDKLQFNNDQTIDGLELVIFNRWGKTIYNKENYTNDWSAEGYPGGIYFYVVKYQDQEFKKTLTVLK